MTAMLMGSLCNIVLDYLLIYPMDMGMFGAAFATGCAPVIGLLTSSIHILTRKNQFHPVKTKISWKEIRKFSGLGISAFINEFSSGFVLVVLNLLILHMTGNGWRSGLWNYRQSGLDCAGGIYGNFPGNTTR